MVAASVAHRSFCWGVFCTIPQRVPVSRHLFPKYAVSGHIGGLLRPDTGWRRRVHRGPSSKIRRHPRAWLFVFFRTQPGVEVTVQHRPVLVAPAPLNPSQLPHPNTPIPPETEFEQMVADSLGRALPLFGQSLFVQPPSTFSPIDRFQVPSDYIIGPGDELQIKVWGQVEADLRVIVDRSARFTSRRLEKYLSLAFTMAIWKNT